MLKMTPGQFSKLVVIFCILHLFVFTYVCLILQAIFGIIVPDALIVGNFAFFGTELAGLLVLKVFRIRRESNTCQDSGNNS